MVPIAKPAGKSETCRATRRFRRRNMRLKTFLPSLGLALLAAEPSSAHTGAGAAFSIQSGFLHPLGGLDHLLAMFAVGLLAAQLGGRAIWLVPGTFVWMMVAGALAGIAGIGIPGVEFGIVISIVAIALPVAFALGMPAALAMAYVGFFAILHGYAHGAELPAGADAAPYIAGFALATALIHATGVVAGMLCGRIVIGQGCYALRIAGGLVAIAGIGIAVA
jgi:urease accessory protein